MTAERIVGDGIVARARGVALDARAKAAARAFAARHRAYAEASDDALAKDEARHAALAAVGAADETLDAAVNELADKLVGAGLAKRGAPFAGLSPRSPSVLCELGYAAEVAAVAKLTTRVRRLRPPRDVLDACNAMDAAADGARAALTRYDGAHGAWLKAAAVRDALLLDLQKALTRFRVLARASLIDDEGAYDALFARRSLGAGPKRKKKRSPKAREPG